MRLRAATEADLGFVIAVERLPAYARLIGQWNEDEHLAALGGSAMRTLIGERGGDRRGFAILCALDTEEPCLRRIAVAEAGRGEGALLLDAVIDHAFGVLGLRSLSLEVFAHNERARRAYRRAGFAEVGFVPAVWTLPDGTTVDDVLMRLTAARRAR